MEMKKSSHGKLAENRAYLHTVSGFNGGHPWPQVEEWQ